jgi:hypothetical protein
MKVDETLGKAAPARTPESVAARGLLSDWKQIARYLGKGVRTVQRWERDLGLPVRRTHKGPKSGVVAFVAEIDVWVKTRQFRGQKLAFNESERVAILLRTLKDLRQENQELRRQLENQRANRR